MVQALGNAEYIENFGDGTGVLGSINPIKVKMPPWQVPPAVAAMPPFQKLPKPTASCGYIINLAENILFDYDKHEQSRSLSPTGQVSASIATTPQCQPSTAHGYGEAQPVALNEVDGTDSPSNRQLNRRVEILVKTQ